MFTVVYELYRDPGLTHQEFVDYWLNVHRPLAVKMPNLKGYEIWPVQQSDGILGEPVDGFVILRFDSEESFRITHDSAEFAEIAEDARRFTRHFTAYVVDRHEVIPASA